jgi:uncharacterized paraquat-inducible protein A
MMPKGNHRKELHDEWVICLNCSYEYLLDSHVPEFQQKGCMICGSKAYERQDEKDEFYV